jgi:hypothetical protein
MAPIFSQKAFDSSERLPYIAAHRRRCRVERKQAFWISG